MTQFRFQKCAVTAILIFIFSGKAVASDWTCEKPQWASAPAMVDGNFVGTVQGYCTFHLNHSADIAALDRHLLESINKSQEIHEGPVTEIFRNLPGVRYDVTAYYPNDNMTVRQNVHLSTDLISKVVYESDSKSVTASGLSEYLRQLNVEFEVTKTENPIILQFKMTTLIRVAKPWYAPSGIFFSKAQESALEQFNKSRDSALPNLETHL